MSSKVIAFYLPQFHPIPENDEWWGSGFTEWTNVTRGKPFYTGHKQPRRPADLGYYDLRVPDIMDAQIDMARQYGVHGFCFYYYWFDGKRLLERPLDMFLARDDYDFPFSICWANENWSRRWDGGDQDILIAQKHSAKSDRKFIRDILPILSHKNYITVDGLPLLTVYRIQDLPNPEVTISIWRQEAIKAGLPGLHVSACMTFGLDDYSKCGCDSGVQFPPHGVPASDVTSKVAGLDPDFEGHIYNYQDVVETGIASLNPDATIFPTVMMGWDNTARKKERGHIYKGCNPEYFGQWLERAVAYSTKQAADKSTENFVFINAWNEWAEGTYLEPDMDNGFGYLEKVSSVLAKGTHLKTDTDLTKLIQSLDIDADTKTDLIGKANLLENSVKFYRSLFGESDYYYKLNQKHFVDAASYGFFKTSFNVELHIHIDSIDKLASGNVLNTNNGESIIVNGWCFSTVKSTASQFYLLLLSDAGQGYVAPIDQSFERIDVVAEYGQYQHLNARCGFSDSYKLSSIKPGQYRLGIMMISDKYRGLKLSDCLVTAS